MSSVQPCLSGKRCLVTGGSRGLGLAIAKAFARNGAKVAFTYSKRDADAEKAADELRSLGAEPHVFKGSVADSAHVRATMTALEAAWGGLDVLVNNAGVSQILPIALLEERDWDETMGVNVKGAYLFARGALKGMIRQRSGVILNIGSFASERIVDAPVHYAASKSALRGFTEALSREVGRYGIRVNLVAPGLLDVGLGRNLPRHRIDEYLEQNPLGRVGTADEVAETLVWFASDDAAFVTGARVAVDGGL